MEAKHRLRDLFIGLGTRLPSPAIRKCGNFVREIELLHWMEQHELSLQNTVNRREELFELVAAEIGQKPALYLEFGVATGDATRVWSRLLTHPDSVLHGFDSFEGLPESWTETRPKGMFSTGGSIPLIDDQRLKFFKGWFEQTLPTYTPPDRDVVVI